MANPNIEDADFEWRDGPPADLRFGLSPAVRSLARIEMPPPGCLGEMGGSKRAALVLAAALALAVPGAASAAAAPLAPTAGELPTCAEGPERVGDEILGTPCGDRIVAPASVAVVDGGPGDDTIVGANSGPVTAATGSPEIGYHLEVGSQTFEGGPGNDIVYGDRGNDTLRGGAGNDRLYGGIGDDVLEGGEGDDLLSGGFGGDKIDGQGGNDFVRGDATIDQIFDTGGGFDTLSFSTATTPGFFDENQGRGYPDFDEYGLPKAGGERGAYVNLAGGYADDNQPNFGGGIDVIQGAAFERVIGSPFADYIVGTSASQTIYGGGGGDVILGGGGTDTLVGGPGGDFLEAAPGSTVDGGGEDNCAGGATPLAPCGGSAKQVTQKGAGNIAIGLLNAGPVSALSVVGSSGPDSITATYSGGSVIVSAPGHTLELGEGCSGAEPITCTPAAPLDSVLLAGNAGNDTIAANGFPDGVSVIAIGGAGEDSLTGGASEDVLVDGSAASHDVLSAGAGDDALVHNAGPDLLDGGEGSDLFLSFALCTGTTIYGGAERVGAPVPDRDNSSWAKLEGEEVDARLDSGAVGRIGAGEQPDCGGGPLDRMEGIEDLEGSNQSDVLVGNEGENQLLGHKGADAFFALGGNDTILANSGSPDRVIDCGPGYDLATIDLASKAVDPAPVGCERIREGGVEEFDELPLLSEPPPTPPAPVVPKPTPKPDRTPPRTKLSGHPRRLLKVRPGGRKPVAFRFGAGELGARFQCKLDRGRYAGCRSPRKYRVAVGRHVFRAFAIDASGNRDRTPAVFQFRVVVLKRHPAHGAR
jgi:Ca2+-binding RTX toxin-like protein